jgi:hypothetical protein
MLIRTNGTGCVHGCRKDILQLKERRCCRSKVRVQDTQPTPDSDFKSKLKPQGI